MGCDGIFEKLSSVNCIDSAWSAVSQVIKNKQIKPKSRMPTSHELTGKMTDAIIRSSALERSVDNLTVVIVAFESLRNFYDQYK